MGSSSGEESNAEGPKNQSLFVVDRSENFNFLALMEVTESDDEGDMSEIKDSINIHMGKTDSEIEEEESSSAETKVLALAVGSDSELDYNENNAKTQVSFSHVKDNLHNYSRKKLESLSCVLIDAYFCACESKESLLKEYAALRTENETLTITNEDLLKEISSLAQINLEENVRNLSDELNSMTEKNELLLKELEQTKLKLEHIMKWTKSSRLLGYMQQGQSTTKYGIGFKLNVINKTKQVQTLLCTLCGRSRHLRNDCQKNNEAIKRNLTHLKGIHGRRTKNQIPPRNPCQDGP